MKIGDLVSWYSYSDAAAVQDQGIVWKESECQVYIRWQSGDGDGWFTRGHPSIGVINYANR